MPYYRTSEHALQDELRALGRRFAELADGVSDALVKRSADGGAMARQAGRQIARFGDGARQTVQRHPAATGLTVAALIGAVALVAALCLRNNR